MDAATEKTYFDVEFREINISCDGEHTSIIIDGVEQAHGCDYIQFTHDTRSLPGRSHDGKPKITMCKELVLKPKKD